MSVAPAVPQPPALTLEERLDRFEERLDRFEETFAKLVAIQGHILRRQDKIDETLDVGLGTLEAAAKRDRVAAELEDVRFDRVLLLPVLKELRKESAAPDPRRYVGKVLSELGGPKAPKIVSGRRVTKVIRAMGYDPVDVDERLRVAEVVA
jgi:hypothetical protein